MTHVVQQVCHPRGVRLWFELSERVISTTPKINVVKDVDSDGMGGEARPGGRCVFSAGAGDVGGRQASWVFITGHYSRGYTGRSILQLQRQQQTGQTDITSFCRSHSVYHPELVTSWTHV